LMLQQSGGNKTAIELFLTGVRGWEAGTRQWLFPEELNGLSSARG
jgi:hypothetical protein